MADEKADDLASLAGDGKYHYSLQEENRERVREQGKKINQTLKHLKRISYDDMEPRRERDDETYPYITLPPKEKVPDLKLVEAYEEAERACSRPSDAPRKKKKWLPW